MTNGTILGIFGHLSSRLTTSGCLPVPNFVVILTMTVCGGVSGLLIYLSLFGLGLSLITVAAVLGHESSIIVGNSKLVLSDHRVETCLGLSSPIQKVRVCRHRGSRGCRGIGPLRPGAPHSLRIVI